MERRERIVILSYTFCFFSSFIPLLLLFPPLSSSLHPIFRESIRVFVQTTPPRSVNGAGGTTKLNSHHAMESQEPDGEPLCEPDAADPETELGQESWSATPSSPVVAGQKRRRRQLPASILCQKELPNYARATATPLTKKYSVTHFCLNGPLCQRSFDNKADRLRHSLYCAFRRQRLQEIHHEAGTKQTTIVEDKHVIQDQRMCVEAIKYLLEQVHVLQTELALYKKKCQPLLQKTTKKINYLDHLNRRPAAQQPECDFLDWIQALPIDATFFWSLFTPSPTVLQSETDLQDWFQSIHVDLLWQRLRQLLEPIVDFYHTEKHVLPFISFVPIRPGHNFVHSWFVYMPCTEPPPPSPTHESELSSHDSTSPPGLGRRSRWQVMSEALVRQMLQSFASRLDDLNREMDSVPMSAQGLEKEKDPVRLPWWVSRLKNWKSHRIQLFLQFENDIQSFLSNRRCSSFLKWLYEKVWEEVTDIVEIQHVPPPTYPSSSLPPPSLPPPTSFSQP